MAAPVLSQAMQGLLQLAPASSWKMMNGGCSCVYDLSVMILGSLCAQSMEDTERNVRMAMTAPRALPPMRFDNDDFIDDAIQADAQQIHHFQPRGSFMAEDW